MLTTIDFDYDLGIDADKVRNVAIDGNLPAELPAMELAIPKMPPQPALGRRFALA